MPAITDNDLRTLEERYQYDDTIPNCCVCGEPLEIGETSSAGVKWVCYKGNLSHWSASQFLDTHRPDPHVVAVVSELRNLRELLSDAESAMTREIEADDLGDDAEHPLYASREAIRAVLNPKGGDS